MKKRKSHFKFTKQERSGIFFLLVIIVLLQVGYVSYQYFSSITSRVEAFVLDEVRQAQIDVLKQKALAKDTIKIYPFNPNFITDYKGYTLGMSVKEIDRLHSYRKENKYVNSVGEFQKVTSVSDSLLNAISPYFKFPEWTQNKKAFKIKNNASAELKKTYNSKLKDLNTVTAAELKRINGIGEKLSARIIKFRDRLGGFLINEQLYDVYGLEAEVVERVFKQFEVLKRPQIKKININIASVEELSKLVYLQKRLALDIVNYRNLNKSINSFDELLKIENFPADKYDRIILYLSLKK